MKPVDFFNKLKGLGNPKCQSYKRYSKKQQSDTSWSSHYGHCLNNHYHFCDFLLEPKPLVYMVHYQRKAMVDGVELRVRSNPVNQRDFKTGRPGRPKTNSNPHTSAKNPPQQ